MIALVAFASRPVSDIDTAAADSLKAKLSMPERRLSRHVKLIEGICAGVHIRCGCGRPRRGHGGACLWWRCGPIVERHFRRRFADWQTLPIQIRSADPSRASQTNFNLLDSDVQHGWIFDRQHRSYRRNRVPRVPPKVAPLIAQSVSRRRSMREAIQPASKIGPQKSSRGPVR